MNFNMVQYWVKFIEEHPKIAAILFFGGIIFATIGTYLQCLQNR